LYKALIVSNSEKGINFLYELLKSLSFSQIITVKNGAEARRTMLQNEFDIAVINSPLSDEFGAELAQSIAVDGNCGVVMLVKNHIADEITQKVEDFGVLVVSKPTTKDIIYQSLKMLITARRNLLKLKKENNILKTKIEDIRLIDRAKCALIQYLNMTEPAAHRYIEKQAMDMRISKVQVSEGILKIYEV